MREVAFKEFQKLMLERRRTVDDLVDIFRGKLDDSRVVTHFEIKTRFYMVSQCAIFPSSSRLDSTG
jgi:hypothetical protein